LAYYRRTEAVIAFITWLVMWTLIGLASVVIFSRPLVFQTVEIPELYTSGTIQSMIGSFLIIAIGVLPVVQVVNAIVKAKRKELSHLEALYDQIYTRLAEKIGDNRPNLSSKPPASSEHDKDLDNSEIANLNTQFETIKKLITQVEDIPNLPIQFGSVLRIVFGAGVSLGSSLIKDALSTLLTAK
jgi:hypothetical protein